MKFLALRAAALLALVSQASAAPLFSVTSQNQGPTPFIVNLTLQVNSAATLDHVDYKIYSKPGSVTRPVFVRYSAAYLTSRGFLTNGSNLVKIPVFGLYDGYNNTVLVSCGFSNQTSARQTITVPTPVWSNSTGYKTPTIVTPRGSNANLTYDFVFLRAIESFGPVIIDTDGAVRWVGATGVATQSQLVFQNGIYMCDGGAGALRLEWDGTYKSIGNYSSIGVTFTGHHMFDPGKTGIVMDCNTTNWTECVCVEIDGNGNVLNQWNFANIISGVMTAGGDDPSKFVYGQPNDWFHNNATCYWPEDDSLVVSSRENFVMCIDYSTGNLKWLLGDPSKYWYVNFPSLRKYALQLGNSPYTGTTTQFPVGQHAVSIYRNHLLLFDDQGASFFSQFSSNPGSSLGYSAGRKYFIDTSNPTSSSPGTATEIWNFIANPHIFANITDSCYEDGSGCYLLDYATNNDLFGIDTTGAVAFQYHYGFGIQGSWNASPIHMENMRF